MDQRSLSVFEAQVRTVSRFRSLLGVGWPWWGWRPAKVSMVSGRLRLSETIETWQVSPYWMEMRGFTKIAVDGIDDEGRTRSLLIKFVNVGDSWKFAESVPGLRWTYWNPTGRLEEVPVKIQNYRSRKAFAFSVALTVGALGFSIWLAFNFLYLGILGTLTTAATDLFLHPISARLGSRRKAKTGHLVIEEGTLVIIAGKGVYFDPTLSERKSRKPRRYVVETRLKKVQIEFANESDEAQGLKLIGNYPHGTRSFLQTKKNDRG